MSNHKHTPGTWEVSSFGDSVQIKKGKRQLHPLSVCLPIFERQANARLIAAAPEMLEALEEVMRPYGIYDSAVSKSYKLLADEFMATGDKIRAAIAKATGKEVQP